MYNLGTTRASLSCTMEEYEVFMICQKGNIVQKVHPKRKLYFFIYRIPRVFSTVHVRVVGSWTWRVDFDFFFSFSILLFLIFFLVIWFILALESCNTGCDLRLLE